MCDAASTTITATTAAVASAVTTEAEAAEAALIEAVFGYIGLGVGIIIVVALTFYCIRRTCCKPPQLHSAGEHHANRMLRHVSSQDKIERTKVRLQTPPPLCHPLVTRVCVVAYVVLLTFYRTLLLSPSSRCGSTGVQW